MQAKIVFRGNKCFREFDLKTVAEKLGLSIDDFNHFALAVDEKNGKTVYASVYAQVPLFETQCIKDTISLFIFNIPLLQGQSSFEAVFFILQKRTRRCGDNIKSSTLKLS